MAEKVPKSILYILMLGMLLAGLMNTTFMKLQNNQTYFNDDMQQELEFQHPFFQTWCMFIGEIICLPLFLLLKWRKTRKFGSWKNHPSAIEAELMGLKLDVNI